MSLYSSGRASAADDPGGEAGHLRLVARHGLRVVRLLPVRLAGGRSSPRSSSPASNPTAASSSRCWPSPRASRCGRSARSFFGRLGDLVGRKYTFLVTILIMGLSTFVVGLLPSYAAIGIAAPVILIVLRLLQGLALGGEYGGAATYVAEHAPHGPARLLHLLDPDHGDARPVPVAARHPRRAHSHVGEELRRLGLAHPVPALDRPARLLGLDPAAAERIAGLPEDEGGGHALEGAADRERSASWKNLKIVAARALRLTAGQAVVWYTGQFYALFFLTQTLKVDGTTANLLIAVALLLGTPFFIFFGWLSDKIGRKPIIMAGCLLAALTYFPMFKAHHPLRQPGAAAGASRRSPVDRCTPTRRSARSSSTRSARAKFTSSCDIAKCVAGASAAALRRTRRRRPAARRPRSASAATTSFGRRRTATRAEAAAPGRGLHQGRRRRASTAAGYPAKADPARIEQRAWSCCCSDVLVIYVTMVYGPIAAMLVELFPTRIRYTVDVAAVSHRQRLVRRLPAADGLRHRGGDRQHLLRPLVPDRRRRDDLRHRPALRAARPRTSTSTPRTDRRLGGAARAAPSSLVRWFPPERPVDLLFPPRVCAY